MKKVILSFLTICTLFGVNIDKNSAKSYYISYKLTKKIGVRGEFLKGKYDFKNTNGSIKEILEDCKISFDFKDQNSKDKSRDKNIERTFGKNLENTHINVILSRIQGDETNGVGVANITFNNVSKDVNFIYNVDAKKIKLSSTINMKNDFNLEKSFIALSTDPKIAALHRKKTWEDVDIFLEINLK